MAQVEHRSFTTYLAVSIAVLSFVPFIVSMSVVSAVVPTSAMPWTQVTLSLVAVSLGALAICVMVAVPVARRIARPLTAMTSAAGTSAQTFAASPYVVERDDPREIVALKSALNASRRKIVEDAEWRTLLTAMVAHDLKSPIVGCLRSLEHVRSAPHEALADGALIEALVAEHRRMLDIVRDVVLVARSDARPVPGSLPSLDLRGLVEEIVVLDAHTGAPHVTVSGSGTAGVDRVTVQRAIANLLENARRHARSRVEVTVFPGLVRVEDDGPGLPQGIEQAATPFAGMGVASASESPAREPRWGESGLGLYIARRLVEAQGGRLAVEHSGPAGTSVLVYLPTT